MVVLESLCPTLAMIAFIGTFLSASMLISVCLKMWELRGFINRLIQPLICFLQGDVKSVSLDWLPMVVEEYIICIREFRVRTSG